ncbi:hypothetical protein ACQ86G_11040 [Roseateles chitinivorans]|uniref:hypothetical protein n=1 Tax=Roseateles chitinivorans TaxID=2917965 RepID=UPI003D6798C0
MPTLKKSDLKYSNYSWNAVPGDNPHRTVEDADRFSRKEGYEVLTLLNSLTSKDGGDLDIRVRQICEWMIHEKLPSNLQGRSKVKAWIFENYTLLSKSYPF